MSKKQSPSDGKEKKRSSEAKTVGKTTTDECQFVLPAQLDISSVTQLYADLKEAYADNAIVFDASAVERITTPGVQLLLSSAATARKRGGVIRIVNPSEALNNSLADLGFSNQLKEWVGGNG